MRRHAFLLVLALLACGALARADGEAGGGAGPQPAPTQAATDVLTLKDGRRIEGEFVGEDDRFVTVKSAGSTRAYARDSIASIEQGQRAGGPPAAPSAQPGAAPAQPPAPASGKEKKGKGDRRDAPLSEAARKWLEELIARTADADESIRRSAAQAIAALGTQAIPAVRAAEAAATDGPQKELLARVANDIESRRDRRARGDGPPLPGEPGRGADGPQPGGARRGLDAMMQRVTEELALTDEQKPKVEAVLKDWTTKRLDLMRGARRDGLTPDQIAEKAAPLRAEAMAQMKTLLTEPQYATFEQIVGSLLEAQRGGGPRGPKPADGAQPAPPKPQDPPPADAPK